MQLAKIALTAIVGTMAVAAPAAAAARYRFTEIATGSYAYRLEGTLVVDGPSWRINYESSSEAATYLTAIAGAEDGLVAINDANHTFFRLDSRRRLAVHGSLFSFGTLLRVSDVRVSTSSRRADPAAQAAGEFITVIAFSYAIDTSVASEKVQGEVWGEIRVWTTAQGRSDLPWRVADVQTGIGPVDDALGSALAKLDGIPWQSEIEVARRLEKGAILKQVTRRWVGDMTETSVSPAIFKAPAGYRYQEPIVGAPGTPAKQ